MGTNPSTPATSFALFDLILNGSGVGRCYDDDMMVVNWDHMPTLRVVLDDSHPDFNTSQHTSVRDAKHLYGTGQKVHWFEVEDILDFIEVKRPIEYAGLTMDEIIAYRAEIMAEGGFPPMAFLWSSNNSVTVDEEFWHRARLPKNHPDFQAPLSRLARDVLQRVAECAYGDGTGEPGIINSHLIKSPTEGQNEGPFRSGDYVGSDRYQVMDETRIYLQRIQEAVRTKTNTMIVNPCGTCVTGDTMVMTSLGLRPVTDLMAAEFDALINGQVFRAGPFRRVGVAPIREIVTVEGYRLKCTNEHRLLRVFPSRIDREDAYSSSAPANSFVIGDQLAMSDHRSEAVDRDDPEFEAGWVIGHVKGNGGHNPNNTSGTYLRFWHGHEYDLEVRADSFVRSLGASSSYRGGSYNRVNGTWTIRSEQLSRFVDRYLHRRSKAIRPALLHGSTAMIAGFLQGFFDSDGSPQGSAVKGRSVRLSQSDEQELLTTQQMLARLGIMSTLALRRKAGERPMPDGLGGERLYSHKSQWEIIISRDNIEEFERKVGFSIPPKRETLTALIENLQRKPNREAFHARVKAINTLPPEPVFDCPVEGLGIYDAGGFCSLTGIR